MHRPRLAAIALLCLILVAGCTPAVPPSARAQSPEPSATASNATVPNATPIPAPSSPPATATPATNFAPDATIAGVAVAGLTLDQAAARVRQALVVPTTLDLRAGPARLNVAPAEITLVAPVDALLAEAGAALAAGKPVSIPLRFSFDEVALRKRLTALAAEVGPPATLTVLTSTNVLSRSFAYTPGVSLDLDAAMKQIGAALAASQPGTITLDLTQATAAPRVSLAQLRDEISALAEKVPGVVGFHLTDLATGESVGFNDRSVFAGASTIKVAIMLNAYINLAKFTPAQSRWISEMIRNSDNIAANNLLAAAAGGKGATPPTEYAFKGAEQLSALLQKDLGLRHTYLYVPFETTDYITIYKPKFRCGPKGPVGEKPYTQMGACLRAEPASMASLYQMIDQCANGTGLLLDKFKSLNAPRCQEMLDWLAKNDDTSRMVAGIPKGVRVEHKSGWIEDLQADNGIVRSPNGAYILSIYYYRALTGGRVFWADEEMAPVVAAFSRLAYTAYNPVKLR
ncbi:MAG: serine hydrolase [Chloroflexales bacterium]